MKHIHTIYVPPGMTTRQAWAEITTMGLMVEPVAPGGGWDNVHCDGEECRSVSWE